MKCPLCGNDNGCHMDLGLDPDKCWCHGEEFPKEMKRTNTCICKDCVIRLKKDELRAEIIKVEESFMNDSIKFLAKGWASYFCDDGMMVTAEHNENIIGKDNIEKAMESAFVGDFKLTWKPIHIDFSDDYSLCYSNGVYERYKDGSITRGKFLTVWKKTSSGWKIKLDIGN